MSNPERGGYLPPEVQKGKEAQSELSPDEKKIVAAFQPDADSLKSAQFILTGGSNEVGLPAPDEAVITQAAKIIGALGKERIPRAVDGGPHKLWLLTEAFINSGKDPSPIHEAALSSLLGGEQEISASLPEEQDRKEINLGPLNKYVELILASGIGRKLGYGDTPGHEYCNFSLNNGNGADLMMHPYGTALKEGEILISFRDRMSRPKYSAVVSSPSEAVRLIKEHGIDK